MIGIFDSGVGGFCALAEVRRLLPRENILYIADRRNAPYGTKSEDDIIAFTEANIKRLVRQGATAVLIACCSASSVYSKLKDEEKIISVPIILPASQKAAKIGRNILVIATERTVKSKEFSRSIKSIDSNINVHEMACQRLVTLVENGNRDGRIDEECKKILLSIKDEVLRTSADGLILGCTHFSHLEKEIKRVIPEVKIISPAKEGAKKIVRMIKNRPEEMGRVTYTC